MVCTWDTVGDMSTGGLMQIIRGVLALTQQNRQCVRTSRRENERKETACSKTAQFSNAYRTQGALHTFGSKN
jgi:hypothetical protein